MIASASSTHKVVLWDVAACKEIPALEGHSAGVRGIAFSPDGTRLVTGSYDKTVRLWNLDSAAVRNPKQVLRRIGPEAAVVSPDGKTLATVSCDNIIRLWDTTICKQKRNFKGHGSCINSYPIIFSPDGRMLVAAASDLRLWDVATGALEHRFKSRVNGIRCMFHAIAFSPDSKTVASCSNLV